MHISWLKFLKGPNCIKGLYAISFMKEKKQLPIFKISLLYICLFKTGHDNSLNYNYIYYFWDIWGRCVGKDNDKKNVELIFKLLQQIYTAICTTFKPLFQSHRRKWGEKRGGSTRELIARTWWKQICICQHKYLMCSLPKMLNHNEGK